ncbi:MAG TPA: hypothetical protein VFJ58_13195 [Armatimonadota bacterium]|nr:hypothetical protein [Armatimonadota bacterium]
MAEQIQATSVRLPADLYRSSVEAARRRGVSLSGPIRDALYRVIKEERDWKMFESATLLGAETDAYSMDFALDAQAEVALRDENPPRRRVHASTESLD